MIDNNIIQSLGAGSGIDTKKFGDPADRNRALWSTGAN